VPPEVWKGGENVGAFLKGTQVEYGRYFSPRVTLGGYQATPQLFVALQGNLQGLTDPLSVPPYITVQGRGGAGYRLEATFFQPRFLLTEPTLAPQVNVTPVPTFGLFLTREWRF
jgi:hypothetical protein